MSDDLEIVPYPAEPGVTYRAGKKVGGAICPRCPKFIAVTSKVVRLYRPEKPDTLDGRHDRSTGKSYYSGSKSIDTKPRWFVHESCWNKK
jgi:hypothetical protein